MAKEDRLRSSFIDNNPWSAAFISTMVSEVNPKFKKSPLHTEYATAVRTKQVPNWKALDPATTQVQPGDIVIANRANNNLRFKSPWSGFSHGDIVTSVNGTKATVIGGNVTNTDEKDSVTKREFQLKKGVLTEPKFFTILRPSSPDTASALVNRVSQEYDKWDAGKWDEKSPEADALLRKYYGNVGLSQAPSKQELAKAEALALRNIKQVRESEPSLVSNPAESDLSSLLPKEFAPKEVEYSGAPKPIASSKFEDKSIASSKTSQSLPKSKEYNPGDVRIKESEVPTPSMAGYIPDIEYFNNELTTGNAYPPLEVSEEKVARSKQPIPESYTPNMEYFDSVLTTGNPYPAGEVSEAETMYTIPADESISKGKPKVVARTKPRISPPSIYEEFLASDTQDVASPANRPLTRAEQEWFRTETKSTYRPDSYADRFYVMNRLQKGMSEAEADKAERMRKQSSKKYLVNQ